eukprot:200418-Chlamydomonas_euryale.AAC.3
MAVEWRLNVGWIADFPRALRRDRVALTQQPRPPPFEPPPAFPPRWLARRAARSCRAWPAAILADRCPAASLPI